MPIPIPICFSRAHSGSESRSKNRSWWGTACGTCWLRGARARWAWGCCRAAMEKKSWSGPARIASIKTPPTCSITSTRSVCAWAARLRRSTFEVRVVLAGRGGRQLHHAVPGARLPIVGPVAVPHPGREGEREVPGEGLHVGLVHAAQLGEPLLEVGPGRSEEHTSELQSQSNLVCRLLL